jgi:flagellar biosynthesis protein
MSPRYDEDDQSRDAQQLEDSGPQAAVPGKVQATALSYEAGDRAPRVVATGTGYLAQRIIEAAEQAGVPVRSDPALTRALSALDLGDEVPEALYRAVAETLAWAYRLDAEALRRLR